MESTPNIYDVFIALIQMLGTAFAVWVAYRQTVLNNRRDASALAVKVEETTSKLEAVHTAVNGNLDAEKKKVEKYAAKLRANGIDPDAD